MWGIIRNDGPFVIEVENTCRSCYAHNVVLYLESMVLGVMEPINEEVIVTNGNPIESSMWIEIIIQE